MAITSTTAKYRKTGGTLDITPSAAIAAGAIIVVGGVTCIALSAIPANTPGALKVLQRGEVVEVTTNEAIGSTNAGVAIYVDSSGLVTKTSTNNTLIGYTAAAVGASDLSFEIVCV